MDPISVRVNGRYDTSELDTGPATATLQVLDGETPIHAVNFEYPHSRDDIKDYGGGSRVRYYLIQDPDRNTYIAQYTANDAANTTALFSAKAWLDTNRPGWSTRQDNGPAKSWLIEGPEGVVLQGEDSEEDTHE